MGTYKNKEEHEYTFNAVDSKGRRQGMRLTVYQYADSGLNSWYWYVHSTKDGKLFGALRREHIEVDKATCIKKGLATVAKSQRRFEKV
jgi:hypothetical protein